MSRALLPLLFALTLNAQPAIVGEYYLGDGLGVNWSLTLMPEGRFSFTWAGCLGEYGHAEGSWTETAGTVFLTPSKMNDVADRLPLEYDVIRWGVRLYLVPPVDLAKFCAYVNQGWEPRDTEHGLFFINTATLHKKAVGRPLLPRQFDEFLMNTPIRGRITTVSGQRGTLSSVEAHRLRVGMLVFIQGQSSGELSVDSVSEQIAIVEARTGVELKVGAPVSTRMYDEQRK